MIDIAMYITTKEAAIALGVAHGTISKMAKAGRIPTPCVFVLNKNTGRQIKAYDKAEFMAWVATNPIKHCGYRDAEERQKRLKIVSQPVYSKSEDDVYCIQRKAEPFVYSGYKKWWILNFRPALLNRGYSYD